MIREYKTFAKVVAGKTVYLRPVPEIIKRKDITKWQVGINGWEKSGATTTELSFENAKEIFDRLNRKYVERLKKNYETGWWADTQFNSDFSILSLALSLKRKRWNEINNDKI